MQGANNFSKVSIIIVNYFCYEQCVDAVESIVAKTKKHPFEIIIVDNSNNKEEFAKLKKHLNDKCILVNPEANLGFGKANNLGALNASGDYLFLQNPDTLLINDTIDILADYLDANPSVGIVGPNVYTKNNEPYHSFIKKEMNIKQEVKDNSFLSLVKRRLFKKRHDFNYSDKPLKIEGYIVGAALLIRKDIFGKVNGFDEDIFMYGEDALICRNVVKKLGYEIYNVPEAKIIHYEGTSFKDDYSKLANAFIDGCYVYYLKSFGEPEAKRYLCKMIKVYKKKALIDKLFGLKLYNKHHCFYKTYQAKFTNLKNRG